LISGTSRNGVTMVRATARLTLILSTVFGWSILWLHASQAQQQWIETTQENFSDGMYETNIYASHRGGGAVEFAPRFDLNNDGYIDLLVANASAPYVSIYWGSATGYSAGNRTDYPNPGAGNCDAGDLDCDGYPDLLTSIRYGYGLKIFWGTASGPDPSDSTVISLRGNSEACFIADADKDVILTLLPVYAAMGLDMSSGEVWRDMTLVIGRTCRLN